MTNIHANPSTNETPTVPKWRRAFYKIARSAPAVAALALIECAGGRSGAERPSHRSHVRSSYNVFSLFSTTWRRCRTESKQIIEHATMYLDDVKNFFPHRVHEVLSNLEAFHRLGKKLLESGLGKKFLAGKTELTVLYPGAGTHLSPLEFAMKLADGCPDLRKVRLVYTEISEYSLRKISGDFETIVSNTTQLDGFVKETVFHPEITAISGMTGLTALANALANGEPSPAEKTMAAEYKTPDGRTVTIELLFAYKMSGADFYRSEYFAQADVLLSHDGTSEGMLSYFSMLKMFMHSLGSEVGGKDRILLSEHSIDGFGNTATPCFSVFGGMDLVWAPFGCGPNHLVGSTSRGPDTTKDSSFEQAAIVYLDAKLVEALKRVPGAVDAYAELLVLAARTGSELESLDRWGNNAKNKPLVEAAFKKVLPVLETDDEETRARFSAALFYLLSRTFAFSIVGDDSTTKYWHTAVAYHLGHAQKTEFSEILFSSVYDIGIGNMPSMDAMQYYSNSILVSYLIWEKTGDPELRRQLQQQVNNSLYSLLTNVRLLDRLLSERGISDVHGDEFALGFNQGGLFVPYEHRQGGINLQLQQHDLGIASIATLLYVGRALGCPAVDEFGGYVRDSGFQTTRSAEFLLSVAGEF